MCSNYVPLFRLIEVILGPLKRTVLPTCRNKEGIKKEQSIEKNVLGKRKRSETNKETKGTRLK
jgi:hypothetical protein